MQLGISMLGLSEAMLMGKKLGLDSELLGNIINTSTGQCWASSVSYFFHLVIALFSGREGRGWDVYWNAKGDERSEDRRSLRLSRRNSLRRRPGKRITPK
jgi:hypothetical protein